MTPDYGKKTKVTPLDSEGSTKTTVKNFLQGEVKRPIKNHYEIKKRVHNRVEEQEAYYEFSEQVFKNPGMLDPQFKIESSRLGKDNGYYYVTKCYTELEY